MRPCGFHSPYEAAAWSVLSQRIRIVQAARLRRDLVDRHGEGGAFPAPRVLRALDLDLPGRKTEYLHAVADAALDGRLDANALRAVDPDDAVRSVQEIKGLGPFAAELVVLRGGTDRTLAEVSEAWRPYRTWAAVHLRAELLRRTSNVEKRLSLSLTHTRALRSCTVSPTKPSRPHVLTSSLTGASASCTAASATTQGAMRAPPGLTGSDTQEAA